MPDVYWSMPYMDCTKCLGCSNIRGAYLFFFFWGGAGDTWFRCVAILFCLIQQNLSIKKRWTVKKMMAREEATSFILYVLNIHIYIYIIYEYIMCSYLLIKWFKNLKIGEMLSKYHPFQPSSVPSIKPEERASKRDHLCPLAVYVKSMWKVYLPRSKPSFLDKPYSKKDRVWEEET